ncbi:MAG: hypothetical protein HZC24_02875 [Rhodocyclales bacterium]|nr:hypothetical protein [Rhodocyclales bacterium]
MTNTPPTDRPGWPAEARPRDDTGLLGVLLLSAMLHALWLALPAPDRLAIVSPPQPPALAVRLVQAAPPRLSAAEQPMARPTDGARSGQPLAQHDAPTFEDAAGVHAEIEAPASAARHSPRIDTATVFAAARLIARDPKPAPAPAAGAALPATVETAVVKATRPDVLVESRSSTGEWIEKRGKTRCVSPTHVPHYLERQAVLTLCEVRKG